MIEDNLYNKLAQEEVFSQMKDFAGTVLMFNLTKEAYSYIKNMKDFFSSDIKFRQDYPEKFKVYHDIYIKFKFLTLNRIDPWDLADFFANHWVEQYEIELYSDTLFYDLFDVSMMREFIYGERDNHKKNILKSLSANKQIIVKSSGQGEKEDVSQSNITVAQVIEDFRKYMYQKKLDKIAITQYLDKVQKEKRYSSDDVKKLSHLLNFYLALNTSSLDPEGIEEPYIFSEGPQDSVKVFKKGTIETFKDPDIVKAVNDIFAFSEESEVDLTDKQKDLLSKYKSLTASLDSLKNRLGDLERLYKNENKFQNNFHKGINSRSKDDITAALLVLASQGHLDEIFERDKKIKDIFKAHLKKKFSDKLASDMENNLRAPVYLSYFLQHLLKDILQMDDNESAVLAIKLVNELKRAGDKEYLPIAYGDLQSGTFKWKAIIEKDDKLELAED